VYLFLVSVAWPPIHPNRDSEKCASSQNTPTVVALALHGIAAGPLALQHKTLFSRTRNRHLAGWSAW